MYECMHVHTHTHACMHAHKHTICSCRVAAWDDVSVEELVLVCCLRCDMDVMRVSLPGQFVSAFSHQWHIINAGYAMAPRRENAW
jgi:hypothetical protein